jgi:restriction endonuclease Mrr
MGRNQGDLIPGLSDGVYSHQIFSGEGEQFIQPVVELLVKMGYGGSIQDAGKAIGNTNENDRL